MQASCPRLCWTLWACVSTAAGSAWTLLILNLVSQAERDTDPY